jgi:hypothetical protein
MKSTFKSVLARATLTFAAIAGAVALSSSRDQVSEGLQKRTPASVESTDQGSNITPHAEGRQFKKKTAPQEISKDLMSEEEFKEHSNSLNSLEVQIEVEQTPKGYSIYLKPKADLPDPAKSPLFSNEEWETYEGYLFRSLNGEQPVELTSTDQEMLAQWRSHD